MASRRGNGEGAIFQRADGRWIATLELGMHPNAAGVSVRKRKVVYGRTRREVTRKLRELQAQADAGQTAASSQQTVADFLTMWFDTLVVPNRKASTIRSYRQVMHRYLIPFVGRYALAELTSAHVDQMIADLRASRLSPRTVQYARNVLRTALGKAVTKWRIVAVNVAAMADVPTPRRPAIVPLSQEQASAFLRATAGDRWEALYVVALSLGMRQGEILGLRWQDVDLAAREIHVRMSLQRADGVLALSELKTDKSRRDLALPKRAHTALLQHRERQQETRRLAGPRWEGRDLVFCTGVGRPLAAHNVVRAFKALLARAELPATIRFYDLRHSCATFLRAQGEDLVLISRVLGHSQISVTVNTYTHVLAPAFRAAADRMDAALGE